MTRSSRAAAILLAAVMLIASVPIGAGAVSNEADPKALPYSIVDLGGSPQVAPAGEELNELDEALNTPGVYLHYTTSEAYPFAPGSDEGTSYGECGNSGVDNSTSFITAELCTGNTVMQYFSFAVYYSTEADHDFFRFSINGEVVAERSGEEVEDASGLFYYSMDLERNQRYVFTWSYTKDGSGAGGNDCVRVMNVYLSRHLDTSTAAAVNAPGCPLIYSPRGNYADFIPYEFEGRLCAAPGCMQHWMNGSSLRARVLLQPGDVITFDYYCDFETDEYLEDRCLVFMVDYNTVLSVHENTDGWQTFSYTLTDGNFIGLLDWGYQKHADESSDASTVLIDNINVIYNTPRDLDAQLNPEGSHLEFTSGGDYPFICYDDYPPSITPYAVSGNHCIDDSVSSISTSKHMLAGDTLMFSYYLSSEADDLMRVEINGDVLAEASGTDHEKFETVGITFHEEGDYEIEWSYVKDGSVSCGDDCLRIANVYVQHTLDNSLNVPGGRIQFYTSVEYPFVPTEDGDRVFAQSTNRLDNQVGALACDIYMHEGDTLSFEYWLDSLAGQDGLIFAVNGEAELVVDGEYRYWQEETFTCPEDGYYQFEWIYALGDSAHAEINCVRIDNVSFSGVIPNYGDVDGSGEIDIADALLTLRGALGLVTLNIDQIAAADVDGNGTVDVSDALTILRFVLGLL